MNWILVGVLCSGSAYAEFDIDDTILYKIDFPGYQQKASKGNQLTDVDCRAMLPCSYKRQAVFVLRVRLHLFRIS